MLRAGFGSRLAWLADPEQEVVFVGRDDEDGRRAGAARASPSGVRRLAGYLARRHDELVAGGPRGRARRAAAARRAPGRRAAEPTSSCSTCASARSGTTGHIPGSAFAPWHDIDGAARRPRPAPADRRACARPASAPRPPRASCSAPARETVIHVVDGGRPRLGPARPPARALRAIGGRRGLRARGCARQDARRSRSSNARGKTAAPRRSIADRSRSSAGAPSWRRRSS